MLKIWNAVVRWFKDFFAGAAFEARVMWAEDMMFEDKPGYYVFFFDAAGTPYEWVGPFNTAQEGEDWIDSVCANLRQSDY